MFFEYGEEVYRALCEQEDGVWAISCERCCAPTFFSEDEFRRCERVPAPEPFGDERELTESERFRMALIAPLLEDDKYIICRRFRCEKAGEIAQAQGVSERSVLRTYYRYLALGTVKKRRREPCVKENKYEKVYHRSITEYHYSAAKPSLRDTYTLMLLNHFTSPDGRLYAEHPSFDSFRHFYYRRGYHTKSRKTIARDGRESFQRDGRTLSGEACAWKSYIGAYQMDATVADIYLVAGDGGARAVDRPNIFLAVDTLTQMVTGIYVGYECGESAAMLCIANAAMDKREFCRRYGIDIQPEEWPCKGLPSEIISDRGSEYDNSRRDAVCGRYGIVWEALPPFRPDAKGTVEKVFDLLQQRYKPMLRGYGVIDGSTQERWATDYREQAALNLYSFTQIVIRCVLFLNNERTLKSVQLTPDMIRFGVSPTPLGLWNWHTKSGDARLLPVDDGEIYKMALPRERVKYTREGIRFRNYRYVSAEYAKGEDSLASVGKTVTVAYDPQCCGQIYLVDNERYIPFRLAPSYAMYAEMTEKEGAALKRASGKEKRRQKTREEEARVRLADAIRSIRDSAVGGEDCI